YGVGEKKVSDFGEKFVGVIVSHCQAKALPTDVADGKPAGTRPPVAKFGPSRPNPERTQAFTMFRQGASIEEVSQQPGRARSTISEYLADFITLERPDSIGAWVPEATYQKVAIAREQNSTDRLRPLFEALGEAVPYDTIKLVIAHLQV